MPPAASLVEVFLMATPPGQGEPLDPRTYKTSVLKVSIHCEGCKRKVKKVLLGVHGVHAVDIDIKQQKVIVNGNVDAATLIQKLEKSRKHAELWPEIVAEKKEKKSHKSKNKEKPIDPETNTQASNDYGGPKKEKPTVKVEAIKVSPKISESGAIPAKNSEGGGGGAVKFDDGVAKNNGGGGGSEAVESKSEGKKPETGSAGDQLPVADKKGGESEGSDKESGGGSDNSSKKKKNERQNSPVEGEPSSGGGPASTRLENQYAGPPTPVSFIPPRHHHGYQYPPQYYAPLSSDGAPDHHVGPPPVNLSPPRHHGYQYAVSYNTSYPTSSYTTSYYASPPPQSYAYVHPGPEMEPPPSDLDSYPRQPLDSFEMFSDENPNGCFIM